jgi:hypothetical protein
MLLNLSLYSSYIKGSNSRIYSGVTNLEVPVLLYISTTYLDNLIIDPNLLNSLRDII